MTFYSIMISNDKHQCTNHFFGLQKLIAITIVVHVSYQNAIMSEIILKITLHGSNYNRLLRHFIPQ